MSTFIGMGANKIINKSVVDVSKVELENKE